MNKVLIIGDEVNFIFNTHFKKNEVLYEESINSFLDLEPNTNFDFQYIPQDHVDALIDYYWPTLCRWIESYTSLYDFKSFMRMYIGRAVALLSRKDIQAVIFPSGISHHLDTVILSIGCEINQIKQFYLYAEGLSGGYLLYLQPQGIESREIVRIDLNRDCFKSLQESIGNYEPPKWGSKLKKLQCSILFSIAFIFLKKMMISLKKLIIKKYDPSLVFEQEFGIKSNSFIPLLKSMKSQFQYIKSYNAAARKEPYIRYISKSYLTFVVYGSYQPEATTAPEGGANYNYIDVIAKIRHTFPNSTIIFKDHPGIQQYFQPIILETRVGYCRSIKFLNILQKLNCKFVPFNDSSDLKDLDAIFVTINGTIAFQRGLNGKKTIVFGLPGYKGLPSILNWSEFIGLDENGVLEFKKKSEKVKRDVKKFLNERYLNYTVDLNIKLGRDAAGSYDSNFAQEWLRQASCVIKSAINQN